MFIESESKAAKSNNHFCAAYGCSLPGGISQDHGPEAKYYCRWHFRVSVGQYDAVSFRINARQDLFLAAVERREATELPAKPGEEYHAYLTRLDAECRKVALDNLPVIALAPAVSKQTTAADGWRLASSFVRENAA
ncbi:MAG: hypothetical protein RKO24_12865 [Candidatus Competibacter sp.]|nr:hypothetical protein [Candidatus Competibacter sp.]